MYEVDPTSSFNVGAVCRYRLVGIWNGDTLKLTVKFEILNFNFFVLSVYFLNFQFHFLTVNEIFSIFQFFGKNMVKLKNQKLHFEFHGKE